MAHRVRIARGRTPGPACPPEITRGTAGGHTGGVTEGGTRDEVTSPGWARTAPSVSVVVSTYGRAAFVPELLAALEAQDLGPDVFEVVVVDNGSGDDTWDVLTRLAPASPLALLGLRLATNRGAGGGRDAGLARARADLVAFTDDDCLPTPGWLAGLLAVAGGGFDVVQGRTEPDPTPGPWPQPWARTIWILEPSWLHETCNIAYRRAALVEAGGFGVGDDLTARASGRASGEDVRAGWRVLDAGGRFAFAPAAVVHHRWMPGSFRDWLTELRQLRDFPRLLERCPGMARTRWRGPFLSARTAATYPAVVGALLAVAPGPGRGSGSGRGPVRRLVGAALTVPWLLDALPRARVRHGRPVPIRLVQIAVGDVVAVASLVEGTVRTGRPVL